MMHFSLTKQFVEISTQIGKFRSYSISKTIVKGSNESGTFFKQSIIKILFMDKMNQLKDLLKHEINDLYSAEEQIIEALPAMIDKARDSKLKKALQGHLRVTETQKQRLDKIQKMLELEPARKGFLSALFAKKCKGMQGLIEEGEKVMAQEMDPDVMDAAIVGCAQKIEHYEICGYGTARAYAEELGLSEVEKALNTTLDEEYESDDLLTELAVARLNKEATARG